jgi:mannose-1-phosphate guanylyltransferase
VLIHKKNPWAVILAGGDGTRLQSLTRFISGDGRPKQFCPILGERTLLGETRARLRGLIPAERTLFVVQDAHEPFYKIELADADPRLILSQPANKGTAAAIAYAVAKIMATDANATIAFFPADHHYDNDAKFLVAVEQALQVSARNEKCSTLIGAQAHSPEIEYGWIEPDSDWGELSRVRRFWEKPTLARAQELLARGCLWNTFVMAGKASAFAGMLKMSAPLLMKTAEVIVEEGGLEDPFARRLFATITPVDFSDRVLAQSTDRLLALPLRDVRWNDLGKPERVIEMLAETRIRPQWATAFADLTKAIA